MFPHGTFVSVQLLSLSLLGESINNVYTDTHVYFITVIILYTRSCIVYALVTANFQLYLTTPYYTGVC